MVDFDLYFRFLQADFTQGTTSFNENSNEETSGNANVCSFSLGNTKEDEMQSNRSEKKFFLDS